MSRAPNEVNHTPSEQPRGDTEEQHRSPRPFKDGGNYVAMSVLLPVLAAVGGGVIAFFAARTDLSSRIAKLENSVVDSDAQRQQLLLGYKRNTISDLRILEDYTRRLEKYFDGWRKPKSTQFIRGVPPGTRPGFQPLTEYDYFAPNDGDFIYEFIDLLPLMTVLNRGSIAASPDTEIPVILYRLRNYLKTQYLTDEPSVVQTD